MDALFAVCIQEEAELLLEMQDMRDLFWREQFKSQSCCLRYCHNTGLLLPLFSAFLTVFFFFYYSACAFSCLIQFFVLLSLHSHSTKGQSDSYRFNVVSTRRNALLLLIDRMTIHICSSFN